MGHDDHSRLVTLGQNLGLLMQTGTLAAATLAGLAGTLIRAPFPGPPSTGCGCGCGCGRGGRCCYEPPVYRCGDC